MSTNIQSNTDKSKNTADALVTAFHRFSKRTGADILDWAQTVLDALQLSDVEKKRFFNAVDLEEKGPVARKLKKIAEKRLRFEAYLDKLPIKWTTTYFLANLDDAEFRIVGQLIKPLVTVRELRDHLSPARKQVKNTQQYGVSERTVTLRPTNFVSLDLSQIARNRQREFLERLKELAAEFGANLNEPEDREETHAEIAEPEYA